MDRAEPAGTPMETTLLGSGSAPSMNAPMVWLAAAWYPPTPTIIAAKTDMPTATAIDRGVRGFEEGTHPK